MKFRKYELSIGLFLLTCFFSNALAGLDKFSYLDKIGDWIIERKVDSMTGEVFCRASLSGKATWFSARPRLDKTNKLILPEGVSSLTVEEERMISELIPSLKSCRSSLIYLPKSE